LLGEVDGVRAGEKSDYLFLIDNKELNNMYRFYGMEVVVEGHKPESEQAIIGAASNEWDFGIWEHHPDSINGYGESYLYFDEGDDVGEEEVEDDFAERFTHAIWRANGAYCIVEIKCTILYSPFHTYELDEEDYEWFVNESGIDNDLDGARLTAT
jgi:hypothetical protein